MKKLANSLKTLKTDYADIPYFHNPGKQLAAELGEHFGPVSEEEA